MTLPEETSLPEPFLLPDDNLPSGNPIRLPPGPRYRSRRALILPSDDERDSLLEKLARRAFPSFEFFLFSLLCGTILGTGYLLDSQSLLLLGILLSPLLTPWVGLTLSIVTGSWRFFFQILGGLFVGSALIFVSGVLAGLAARLWMPPSMVEANIHSQLWWPNLFVLALGAVLMVVSFVRSEEKPILPSVMLAYELYLPLNAAGFGLGSGTARIWPDSLMVFLFHFVLAVVFGAVTLAILHFHPHSAIGFFLPVSTGLAGISLIFLLSGWGNIFSGFSHPHATAVPVPTVTRSSDLPSYRTSTPTSTLTSFDLTPTPSLTILQTPTPSQTFTPQPTPVYAQIHSPEGANVRSEPGSGSGTVITALLNESTVEVLPDIQIVNQVKWVHIRIPVGGIEGWVLYSVLQFSTPVP